MKQQLTEALSRLESEIELHRDDDYNPGFVAWLEDQSFICAAARLVERLLPGECENCDGTGGLWSGGEEMPQFSTCSACRGSGRVWDEGIVEAVAKAIHPWDDNKEIVRERARAVLSALVELLTEKVET